MSLSVTSRRSPLAQLAIVLAALVALLAVAGPALAQGRGRAYYGDNGGGSDGTPSEEPAPAPQPEPAPPATPEPAPAPAPAPATGVYDVDVVVEPGQDLQALVAANPPGTVYLLATGVHRVDAVVAQDGDVFVGETGAVVSGARDLTVGRATWEARDGFWTVGGQDQEGFVHGTIADGGNPLHARPEELWVDRARWEPVGSVAELGPGRWFFDYAADRIWIGADPAGFGSIEVSSSVGAFGGDGVRDVVIDNLVIERYATPAQHGAVAFYNEQNTYDWTIRNSTVRENHGAGIRLAPGMTIEGVDVYGNGQIGIAGNGTDPDTGYTAPITIRGSNIHNNRVLDYAWGWEGGAMKIKDTTASVIEGNWIHDNGGPGIWYDVDNRGAVIRNNLVEYNEQAGIFYEISEGPTEIVGNTTRGNGLGGEGDEGAGIDISNSTDVRVAGNTVYGNRRGILIRDDGRAPGLRRVVVEDNTVATEGGWVVKVRDALLSEVTFSGNTWATDADATDWRDAAQSYTFAQWTALGFDRDGQAAPIDVAGSTAAYQSETTYGAR